jgi:O-acetylserine/cysteine efflux transporter
MDDRQQHHGLTAKDLIAAAAINLTWGLNIIATKLAVDAFAPFTVAALRQLLVCAACLPFLRIVPGRMKVLLWTSFLSGAGYLIVVNLSLLVSDNVAALAIAGQLGVPFALILAVLFHGERIALPRMIGIACAFGGVLLLVFDPRIGDEVPGLLLMTLGALIWAIGSMLQRGLADIPVTTMFAWFGVVGAIVLTPLALVLEPRTVAGLPQAPLRDYLPILFSAFGSTLLGQGGMAWLLQRHSVATVTPMLLVVPVISVAAAWAIFGSPLTPMMLLGGVLAMIGVAIITLRSARRPRLLA